MLNGFAKIGATGYKIRLIRGVEQMHCLFRHRTAKKEQLERNCIGRLLELGG